MSTELDCRGLTCPQPVIRCRDLFRKEKPEALDVLVDNVVSKENVSRFLEKSGYAVEAVAGDGNVWRLRAKRVSDVPVDDTLPQCEPSSASRVGGTVLLLMAETLGRGDDELGALLVGNFIGAFKGMGLWAVILMNGGVKLACREGKALESLRALADEGVSVEVCGTCLNHFGLVDELRVGSVSNMYDIAVMLNGAGKVIRP